MTPMPTKQGTAPHKQVVSLGLSFVIVLLSSTIRSKPFSSIEISQNDGFLVGYQAHEAQGDENRK